MPLEPQFPIRIVLDDGDAVLLAEPDDLFQHFNSLDTDQMEGLWARDDLGRTVRITLRDGQVERFELA